jgi:cobalamin synthase
MIGKAHWFKYRTFGWGLAPRTWEGWVYVAIAAFLMAGTLAMGINDKTKMWIFAIIMVIFVVDVLVIMTQLPKVTDERENYHQLVIERNCSFAAIVALLAIAIYQTYQNTGFLQSQNGTLPFDLSIVIVLGVMLVTKIVSTIYVKAKM